MSGKGACWCSQHSRGPRQRKRSLHKFTGAMAVEKRHREGKPYGLFLRSSGSRRAQ